MLDIEAQGLTLVDPHEYHLDTAFCPLPQGQAIAYDGAFSGGSVVSLNATFGADILWVSEEDARDFACNAVSIGRSIILHKASAELKGALARRGFESLSRICRIFSRQVVRASA